MLMMTETSCLAISEEGQSRASQCLTAYKPSHNRKRNTKNKGKTNVEQALETEDSIRKEVVRKELQICFIFSLFSLPVLALYQPGIHQMTPHTAANLEFGEQIDYNMGAAQVS